MTKGKIMAMSLIIVVTLPLCSQASALEKIIVGYFPAWPMPNLVGQIDGTFDSEMGIPLKWRQYESSWDMNRAFETGELDIAIGHELVPFLHAAGNDLPVVATGIAVSYPEYDNCIVSVHSGIDRENIKQLEGEAVYTIAGTLTHYRMVKMLEHLGVDPASMELHAVGDGTAVSKAVYKGWAALGCAYAGPLERMLESGQLLMSGQELENIGLRYFDLITMSRSFLENNHELARQFMAITDRLNRQYDTAPGPMESAIAQGAGLRVVVANRLLQKFSFPSAREQKSGQWLGDGGVIKNDLPELAAFLALHGDLDKPLSSYGEFFDTGLLE